MRSRSKGFVLTIWGILEKMWKKMEVLGFLLIFYGFKIDFSINRAWLRVNSRNFDQRLSDFWVFLARFRSLAGQRRQFKTCPRVWYDFTGLHLIAFVSWISQFKLFLNEIWHLNSEFKILPAPWNNSKITHKTTLKE